MKSINKSGQNITVHTCNTIIVGAGAAGMCCAKKLYENLVQKDVEQPQKRLAVITNGLPLGASRMSGSDKQTYYKMGTSPDVADTAESFAQSLTAGGCCHHDLALTEAIGSLRGFYHLCEVGVPFPHDARGAYIGYKTDHDPYERATSAGPKTSKFMSECLQKYVEVYGIPIYDRHEAVEFITTDPPHRRIVGLITIDQRQLDDSKLGLHIFLAENIVLAGGGPGALYQTSVYPRGQIGIHGLALRAGLAGENLTESQFGLSSTKFRWNVSGSYMQAIPRIYSTDAEGNHPRDFLADVFPSMSKMASNIFLKGYQWPFDPQRIENYQSSLIDILVFNETQNGHRIFMDFRENPRGSTAMQPFNLDDLEEEAINYLRATGALQARPIERLGHMNPPAIDLYKENNIDLHAEPLEIAVCAQHNNGGFAVDRWWQSNIPHTFIIGEMAGTHGVKRPGGSALNAGQVGAIRAAEYIANVYSTDIPEESQHESLVIESIGRCIKKLRQLNNPDSICQPVNAIAAVQSSMTAAASHLREKKSAAVALTDALKRLQKIQKDGFNLTSPNEIVTAVRAEHLTLTSAAYLKAILSLLEQGGGSRGSHLVLTETGQEIHPDIMNLHTGSPLRFKPENIELRNTILRLHYDPETPDLFQVVNIPVREVPAERKAFEPAWQEFREKKIFT